MMSIMGIYGYRRNRYYRYGLPKKPPARQPWRTIFWILLVVSAFLSIMGFIVYHNDEAKQNAWLTAASVCVGIYFLLSLYWTMCVKDPCGEEKKAREMSEKAVNDPDNDGYVTLTVGDDGKVKDVKVTFRDPEALSRATRRASGSGSGAPADASALRRSSSAAGSRGPRAKEGSSSDRDVL